jgi:hypothetical protein
MKNSTMRWMIMAAALAVVAGSASAQTYKAEIPMSFRVGNKVMAAGSYEFSETMKGGGQEILMVRALDHNSMALLMPAQGDDAPVEWRKTGNAVVTFACDARSCTLHQLWDGHKPYTYEFHGRKAPASEVASHSLVTVPLTAVD